MPVFGDKALSGREALGQCLDIAALDDADLREPRGQLFWRFNKVS